MADRSLTASGACPDAVSWDDRWPVHAPVGTFRPNPFGLHDTIGNVWEWCRDLQGDYTDALREGDGERRPFAAVRRVIRGGSWAGDPKSARSAFRDRDEPDFKMATLGVRAARALQGEWTCAAGGR